MNRQTAESQQNNDAKKGEMIPLFFDSINRYQPMIIGFFLSKTNSNALAEDLTQEVFLKAWEFREQFDAEKGRMGAYLFGIARHELINYWRKEQGEKRIPLESAVPDEATLQIQSSEITIIDRLEEEEAEVMYAGILECLLSEGGYPHQVLSFLFSRVIHCGEDDTGRKSGYPKKTADHQGDTLLGKLHQLAMQHYQQYSTLSRDKVFELFQCLNPKLNRSLQQLFEKEKDTTSLKMAEGKGLLNTFCRKTCLKDYANQPLDKAISDWCYKVGRRIKKKMIQPVSHSDGKGV